VFITILLTLFKNSITFSIEERVSRKKFVKEVTIEIDEGMELYPCFSAMGKATITFGAV